MSLWNADWWWIIVIKTCWIIVWINQIIDKFLSLFIIILFMIYDFIIINYFEDDYSNDDERSRLTTLIANSGWVSPNEADTLRLMLIDADRCRLLSTVAVWRRLTPSDAKWRRMTQKDARRRLLRAGSIKTGVKAQGHPGSSHRDIWGTKVTNVLFFLWNRSAVCNVHVLFVAQCSWRLCSVTKHELANCGRKKKNME